MIDLLHDMYAHQAWADAEHWKALETCAGALDDHAIRTRLHHIHLVQRAFLSIVRGEHVVPKRLEDYPSMAALKESARSYHAEAAAFLETAPDARIDQLVVIPWFKNPPIRVTIGQALTQAAMHSHYHRGQNATRLRELGGEPPMTDMIVWWWKGRPDAVWT